MYKTSYVATLLHVSQMTIGRWVKSFTQYLSPSATISDGTQRRFTEDDLTVLSYIAQMKKAGNTLDLIALGLANGERADIPTTSNELATVNSNQLATLNERIKDLETLLEKERSARYRAEGQVELLEKQLEKLQERLFRRDW